MIRGTVEDRLLLGCAWISIRRMIRIDEFGTLVLSNSAWFYGDTPTSNGVIQTGVHRAGDQDLSSRRNANLDQKTGLLQPIPKG